MNSNIHSLDLHNNETATIDYSEERQVPNSVQKSGKISIQSHYILNPSQQYSREFDKQNVKSKHLQNSQTINWLKKRYMNKTKEDYMINQDEYHQESKDIINIYKDFINNSQIVSNENINSDRKKLQMEDMCGYLQKNEVNISQKQFAQILNKKQSDQPDINLNDFHRIMMSQTFNEKFQKCLQSQEIQSQKFNSKMIALKKKQLRQNLVMQKSNQDINNLLNFQQSSSISIQDISTIDNQINQNQHFNKIELINKTAQNTQQEQKRSQNNCSNIQSDNVNFNNDISSYILQQKNNEQKNLLQPQNFLNSSQELNQSYLNKFKIVNNENSIIFQEQQKTKNKSLKNLMNNIHFQMKRQKLLDEFEKAKDNNKIKAYHKYLILENLLNLPQYQINNYKQSEQLLIKKDNSPLFLQQSGQLDQLQALKGVDDSILSTKKRRNNLNNQNDRIQSSILTSNENENRNKANYDKKNNNNEREVNNSDISDQVNDDEEEYEIQMLVQRARYKAKKQFKNDILFTIKSKQDSQSPLNEINAIQQQNKNNSTSINFSQKKNQTNRQIRTNSLIISESKCDKDTVRSSNKETIGQNNQLSSRQYNQDSSRGQREETIRLQNYDKIRGKSQDTSRIKKDVFSRINDQSDYKNKYFKINKINSYNNTSKNCQIQQNGNVSTQDSYNFDKQLARTDEERFKSTIKNNTLLSTQQYFQQFPHIPSNCKIKDTTAINSTINTSNNIAKNINDNNNLIYSNSKHYGMRKKFKSVFTKIHGNISDNNIKNNNINNSIDISQQKQIQDNNQNSLLSFRNTYQNKYLQKIRQINHHSILDNNEQNIEQQQQRNTISIDKNIPYKQENNKRKQSYSFSVLQNQSLQNIYKNSIL